MTQPEKVGRWRAEGDTSGEGLATSPDIGVHGITPEHFSKIIGANVCTWCILANTTTENIQLSVQFRVWEINLIISDHQKWHGKSTLFHATFKSSCLCFNVFNVFIIKSTAKVFHVNSRTNA